MAHRRIAVRWLIVLLAGIALVLPAQAGKPDYSTGFARWRAAGGGFAGWELAGTTRAGDGALRLDPQNATWGADPYPLGGYYGHNFYNGGTFCVGEAAGPVVSTPFAFTEAIASWNASTPTGTWIETLIRAEVGGRWTKWYNLGIWAADGSTVERHSVSLQGDADGYVAVDTLVLSDKKAPAQALQLKLRLFSADGSAIPAVRNVSVAYSTTAGKARSTSAGNPALWDKVLDVPQCSQMVYEGGNVWCSPTSTSMVLGYWGQSGAGCPTRVQAAVAGIYDWLYDGTGNWPFNTAYAATYGLEAYVARLTGLDQAEPWIAAGVPVIISNAWKKNSLDGAPVSSSDGHLTILVGFDAAGNPVVNDPAAASDSEVRRTYDRAQYEAAWLENSGGTVYLIYPAGTAVPALSR